MDLRGTIEDGVTSAAVGIDYRAAVPLGSGAVRRAVLVTVHFAASKRRAGFHWIADAFHRSGWQVTVITVAFSQLSRLKADHRFQYGFPARANRLLETEDGIDSYVWFTPFHPLNRLPAAANVLLAPLFQGYGALPMPGLQPTVSKADLIVFESSPGLMLLDRFRSWAPDARFVYRASDDLELLRAHPVVLEAETRALPSFDLVSVPTASMSRRFANNPSVRVHPHGVRADIFDAPSPDPFERTFEGHAVFVGTSHLDAEFLDIAAQLFPGWQFHVIGPLANVPPRQNVVRHGELRFEATVPFITHADIGLATRSYAPGAESLTDSLKVVQYTYARLPIVAPDFLRSSRSNVVTYQPGDRESIRQALSAAKAMDRSMIDRSGITSWTDLARALAGPLWSDDPPTGG